MGFTERGIPSGGIFAGAEGVKTAEEAAVYGGAAGSWFDPCYHQLCDNLITVMTGVPALDAEGLAPGGTEAEKHARSGRWRGSIKSLTLSAAASYAVYYFAASKDPFSAKVHKARKTAKAGKTGRDYRWHGHGNPVRR